MSDDTPLHIRNEKAIIAGVERTRDEHHNRLLTLEKHVQQLEQRFNLMETKVMEVLTNRGSGPTESG